MTTSESNESFQDCVEESYQKIYERAVTVKYWLTEFLVDLNLYEYSPEYYQRALLIYAVNELVNETIHNCMILDDLFSARFGKSLGDLSAQVTPIKDIDIPTYMNEQLKINPHEVTDECFRYWSAS